MATYCSLLAKFAIPHCLITPDSGAKYCDDRVCLSVCLHVCPCVSPRAYLWNYTSDLRQMLCPCYVHVRGLVLLWQHSDTLCISGFTDDVIFAHKPRLLDVALN